MYYSDECYLDNSATTAVDVEVAELVCWMMTECYGNPSSLHQKGLDAQLKIEEARARLAAALGCDGREKNLIFTSGATEANNLALFGAAQAYRRSGNRIVTTAMEHSSVLEAAQQLERQGFEVIYLNPDENGVISTESVAAAVDDKTLLVSVMMVNNEIGSIQPIGQIVRAVKRKNPKTLVHTDAVQALGKLPFHVNKLGVDLLSVTGHKIHAPKGIGALYVRDGVRLSPQIYGGEQQRKLRPGTENAAYIAGFGLAAKNAVENLTGHLRHVVELTGRLKDLVAPLKNVCINSPSEATPYMLNLSVPGIRSEIMLHFLEQEKIYVSSGSACAKGAKSHVLKALGLDNRRIDSALRVSLGKYNDLEQIERFVEALKKGIESIYR